jgi:hypothetical protein
VVVRVIVVGEGFQTKSVDVSCFFALQPQPFISGGQIEGLTAVAGERCSI